MARYNLQWRGITPGTKELLIVVSELVIFSDQWGYMYDSAERTTNRGYLDRSPDDFFTTQVRSLTRYHDKKVIHYDT